MFDGNKQKRERYPTGPLVRLGEKINNQDLVLKNQSPTILENWRLKQAPDGKLEPLILKAPTGSGKTMYAPRILLDTLEKNTKNKPILVLQPTVAAAINAQKGLAACLGAEHHAEEKVGIMTSRISNGQKCSVQISTPGVLYSILMKEGVAGLGRYAGFVIDEVHNKSEQYAFIIGALKVMQEQDRLPPTIFTSAEFDVEKFKTAFSSGSVEEIASRLHPIEQSFLDTEIEEPNNNEHEEYQTTKNNADLRKELENKKYLPHVFNKIVEFANEIPENENNGDILVFLTGKRELDEISIELQKVLDLNDFNIIQYYRDANESIKDDVENRKNVRAGQRRIILSTNATETGITIPQCGYVVDCGRRKHDVYNPQNQTDESHISLISLEEMIQRAGRAGRNFPGKAWVALPEWAANNAEIIDPYRKTDLAYINLAKLMLSTKKIGYDLENFPFMENPFNTDSINQAKQELYYVGATTSGGSLTAEGRTYAELPFSPRLSRLFLESTKSKTVPLAMAISALHGEENTYLKPPKELVEEGREQRDKNYAFEIVRQIIRDTLPGGFDLPKRSQLLSYLETEKEKNSLSPSSIASYITNGLEITLPPNVDLEEEISAISYDTYPAYAVSNIINLVQKLRQVKRSDALSQINLFASGLANGLADYERARNREHRKQPVGAHDQQKSKIFQQWCRDYGISPVGLSKMYKIVHNQRSSLKKWATSRSSGTPTQATDILHQAGKGITQEQVNKFLLLISDPETRDKTYEEITKLMITCFPDHVVRLEKINPKKSYPYIKAVPVHTGMQKSLHLKVSRSSDYKNSDGCYCTYLQRHKPAETAGVSSTYVQGLHEISPDEIWEHMPDHLKTITSKIDLTYEETEQKLIFIDSYKIDSTTIKNEQREAESGKKFFQTLKACLEKDWDFNNSNERTSVENGQELNLSALINRARQDFKQNLNKVEQRYLLVHQMVKGSSGEFLLEDLKKPNKDNVLEALQQQLENKSFQGMDIKEIFKLIDNENLIQIAIEKEHESLYEDYLQEFIPNKIKTNIGDLETEYRPVRNYGQSATSYVPVLKNSLSPAEALIFEFPIFPNGQVLSEISLKPASNQDDITLKSPLQDWAVDLIEEEYSNTLLQSAEEEQDPPPLPETDTRPDSLESYKPQRVQIGIHPVKNQPIQACWILDYKEDKLFWKILPITKHQTYENLEQEHKINLDHYKRRIYIELNESVKNEVKIIRQMLDFMADDDFPDFNLQRWGFSSRNETTDFMRLINQIEIHTENKRDYDAVSLFQQQKSLVEKTFDYRNKYEEFLKKQSEAWEKLAQSPVLPLDTSLDLRYLITKGEEIIINNVADPTLREKIFQLLNQTEIHGEQPVTLAQIKTQAGDIVGAVTVEYKNSEYYSHLSLVFRGIEYYNKNNLMPPATWLQNLNSDNFDLQIVLKNKAIADNSDDSDLKINPFLITDFASPNSLPDNDYAWEEGELIIGDKTTGETLRDLFNAKKQEKLPKKQEQPKTVNGNLKVEINPAEQKLSPQQIKDVEREITLSAVAKYLSKHLAREKNELANRIKEWKNLTDLMSAIETFWEKSESDLTLADYDKIKGAINRNFSRTTRGALDHLATHKKMADNNPKIRSLIDTAKEIAVNVEQILKSPPEDFTDLFDSQQLADWQSLLQKNPAQYIDLVEEAINKIYQDNLNTDDIKTEVQNFLFEKIDASSANL